MRLNKECQLYVTILIILREGAMGTFAYNVHVLFYNLKNKTELKNKILPTLQQCYTILWVVDSARVVKFIKRTASSATEFSFMLHQGMIWTLYQSFYNCYSADVSIATSTTK